MKVVKPSRPYTDYNIFFQLEREYILQNELEVKPSFDPSETFDESDAGYNGPPLPPRYSEIVLHKNWYKTGKGRKKRRHRITHGKIGFCELSKKIAAIWYGVDEVTKKFCEVASDACMLEYKVAMREYNKLNNQDGAYSPKSKPKPNKKAKKVPKKLTKSMLSQAQERRKSLITPELPMQEVKSSLNSTDASEELSQDVIDIYMKNITPTPPLRQPDLVDMGDDEILKMWLFHHKETPRRVQVQAVQPMRTMISIQNNLGFARPIQPVSLNQTSESIHSILRTQERLKQILSNTIAKAA